ncbi:MAG: hypothetical protein AAFO06_10205 [Cyanobacteria bacterium J06597_16]
MEISLDFNDFHQAAQRFSQQYGGVCQIASQEAILLIPERFGKGTLRVFICAKG